MNRLKRLERALTDAHVWCYPSIVLCQNGVATTRTKPERTNEVDRIQDMIVVYRVIWVIVTAAHETIVA